MARLQKVGYLIPLDKSLGEDKSGVKIPLSEGPNVIGRSNVLVSDKRISRKHITLTTSADGSAKLLVEGTNPVVVNSGNGRKKFCPRENAALQDGDVIELIPGHYLFKYASLGGAKSQCSNMKSGYEDLGQKRLRQVLDDKISERHAKRVEMGGPLKNVQSGILLSKKDNSVEAIRDFHVPNDRLPMTFRLLSVKGLPSWANTSCVRITDVIQGDILFAVLSNYMVDIDWLIPACPTLAKVPHVLVIHGEGDGTLDHMKRKKPENWILHKPPLPISFGTHHSKAIFLVYPRGIRMVVHTANLIYVDWNNKSQGLWMQDFPWKDQNVSTRGCAFEDDLVDYLSALKWPEFPVNFPALGNFNINPSFFRKFDYSSAAVRLIASVPGYHMGRYLKKWGHMKLRSVLQECTFDREFQRSPLVYQFSSIGSLDEKWMAEFAASLSSGSSADKTPLGLGEPLIVWPTVEDVRCSLEGYAAGNAIPSPLKNVEKGFLKKYWAKWKSYHSGRCHAMPHIKTFARYNGQKLAWLVLTSSNLSKAAWGALQKNNSQLMIRSYELGVLFLPQKRHDFSFSCTKSGGSTQDKSKPSGDFEERTELVTLAWKENMIRESSSEVIQLPMPYELPPQPYGPQDVPWSWDRRYTQKDVHGAVWPRQVQLYAA
ncbi:tyrosyl-DNA phosphodiesterase 1 [Momordica charantia]|uniref:Tyrosyl-DNA phosphodiesterase 1 n=1 Tax=Momordica charantia TaxID=3673 RepID=A0A6J1CLM2_MOMCH|nr:tyrosyl-DNA phosphodiesterase 1 [Momordica charantia]